MPANAVSPSVTGEDARLREAVALAQRRGAQLQLALNAGRMGTWRYDLVTGQQEWDATQYALFGLDPSVEPTRTAFMALLHPDDVGRVNFADDDLRPGHFHDTEFRIIRPSDGELRWVTARSFALHDADGTPIERIGVNWDVTAQRLGQVERAEAERRLDLATGAAEIGIWDWDVTTGTFFYSPRARAMYGFTPDEVITFERLQQRTLPEDYKKIEPILNRALDPATRGHERYRYRITRADTGEERWLLAHGSAVFSSAARDAKPLSFTGTLQDITEEVRIQRDLRDQQTRLELAIGAGELAVWELNLKTNAITTSPELNRLYRFESDAKPGLDAFTALYAPGERERVEAESAQAIAAGGTAIHFEAKHAWPDGTIKWIGVRAQLLSDDTGMPARIIGVAMDATERRLNEERLRVTAEELQHRVKNNLAIVQSIAAQTFRAAPTKAEGVAAFSGRLRALGAATDLLTRGNWQLVSVGDIVDEAVSPYRDASVDRFAIGGEPLRIASKDAVNLGMALHELCTNAVKYGALSVDRGRVLIHWTRDGEEARLEWRELGGPKVEVPKQAGFGSKLLRSELFDRTSSGVDLQFLPEGVFCRIVFPLSEQN